MKNLSFFIIIALTGCLLSCSKNASEIQSSKIIYERSLKNGAGSSIFDDHVTMVETVSMLDTGLTTFFSSGDWSTICRYFNGNLKMDSIRRISFDNVRLVVYQVPVQSNKIFDVLNIYAYAKNFVVTRAQMSADTNNYRKYIVSTYDLAIEYEEFYLNNYNQIGKYYSFNEVPFTSLGNCGDNQVNPCNSGGSYGKCMQCAIEECSHDWICAVVCAIFSPQCLAGFGLGCVAVFWNNNGN